MTTIVEFLTARLADQMALVREVQAQAVTDGFETNDPRRPDLRLARLAEADVAAKRRVIAYISRAQANAGEPPHFDRDDAAALTHILRLLALPFAHHPDYQQGWAL